MLRVITEGLMASGANVGAVGTQQGAVTAAAMPAVSALTPSGIDEVSATAATAFSAQGLDFNATSAEGTAMLLAASEGMTAVGGAYDGVDAVGAAGII